jgi:hypothetical protein
MKRAIAATTFGVTALIGCSPPATQEGRLYRLDVPSVSRFTVRNAAATSSEISVEMDGLTCQGRVSRTDAADSSVSPESQTNATSDGGVGMVICGAKVLHCQFVHRLAESYAYGECADQNGGKYTVLF